MSCHRMIACPCVVRSCNRLTPRNESAGERICPATRLVAFFVILSVSGPSALAKAPTLTSLFPGGAARGQIVTVSASGTFDHWPIRAWVDGQGIEVKPDKEKGKLSISVAPDAEPGVRWLRLYDEEGATALRPFLVGTLPEILESEPNDHPRDAQKLESTSLVVNGRLGKSGDVDGFAVPLTRGQTLVVDLEANRHLGSPMDAVLQIASSSGIVLAQNDDAGSRDPRLVFQSPADGIYLIRVFAFPATPDSTIRFAGGDAFVYRLSLTTGGFVDYAYPLAVSADSPSHVEAVGWNIPPSARILPVSAFGEEESIRLFHPLLANTVELKRHPWASVIETEPNDLSHPQRIGGPVSVSGRLDPGRDVDVFLISLKSGEKRTIAVESRTLGRPVDAVVRMVDARGKTLAESDDTRQSRDPSLSFSAPSDGEYRIVVSDLNSRGGPAFAYVLNVLSPQPEPSLSIASDRFELAPGKTLNVPVTIERKDGFAGSIEIRGLDLPTGVSSAVASSRSGDPSAKTVTVVLTAEDCACSGAFRIVGTVAEGSPATRNALAGISGFEIKTKWPWLTIRETPPEPKKP
jgi:hypothetical protein